ncbi:DNA-binding response regulator [Synergistales bacterium]|nr:DNA-binding response regulator [Synergistales bacterium]
MKLLIVDDDLHIRKLVATYAAAEGFACTEAENGSAAIDAARARDFDVIILDVMMSGIDGFETLSEIRRFCNTPVIMLTARTEEYDRLRGFTLGSDDYVQKPFSPKELMARIKAILKRASGINDGVLKFGSFQINAASRSVLIDDDEITLTPREFDLLFFMAKHNHIALRREQLLDRVWGVDYCGDERTLDTHIKSLRACLGIMRHLIVTVWGVGYKFDYREDI